MSYADLTYYKTTYNGTDPGDDTELQKMLDRATDDINMVCGGPYTVADLYDSQVDYLKKANCAQAEFYIINGETYNTGSAQSESIGKFSRSGGNGFVSGTMAPRAKNYMSASGLCNRAIPVSGRGGYYY